MVWSRFRLYRYRWGIHPQRQLIDRIIEHIYPCRAFFKELHGKDKGGDDDERKSNPWDIDPGITPATSAFKNCPNFSGRLAHRGSSNSRKEWIAPPEQITIMTTDTSNLQC